VLRRFRPHLTYANVMATIAVFLALGGGAYAAFNVPKDSVGSKQVKNHSLRAVDLKRGTIPEFGTADGTSTTQKTLITLDKLGVKVTTDGDSDNGFDVRFHNTRSSGTLSITRTYSETTGGGATPAPGQDPGEFPLGGYNPGDGHEWYGVALTSNPKLAATINCFPSYGTSHILCFAITTDR
jgi:hypothetical protein